MKKATTIFSITLLGSVLMSFAGICQCETECENLQIEDITFIEAEEEIDLGFDTAQYLPAGFDPFEGMEPDLEKIAFIESEDEIKLDFDTASYLPEDFNAYEGMVFDIDEIEYIEEEEINLDFDVHVNLPASFNTSSK